MEFTKKISVVMPTYNTPVQYLTEAVDSILNQSFQDFEFIIIDDGSTNGSDVYLKSLQDQRVKIIWNPCNLGVTKTLNIGLQNANGKYIVRMDSDDISYPTRFEKQYAFMENNPNVIVCGTNIEFIGAQSGITRNKIDNIELYRCKLLFYNPGPTHPSVIIRNETLRNNNIQYNEKLKYAQDYDLWTTIIHYGEIAILDDILLRYRVHDKQVTIANNVEQSQCDEKIQRKMLSDLLGMVTDEEVHMHYVYSTLWRYHDTMITPQINRWYDRLIMANDQHQIYNKKQLQQVVEQIKEILVIRAYKMKKTRFGKIALNFRYLSFPSATRVTVAMSKRKIRVWLRNYKD